MNLNQTITVLEALASGCSPTTGTVVTEESVLNERDVIRALQVAIERLKNEPSKNRPGIDIDAAEIRTIIQLLSKQEQTVTPNKLADFFLAGKAIIDESFTAHELYGKYKERYAKDELQDFFSTWLQNHGAPQKKKRSREMEPWKAIDFFQQVTFNHYSPEGMEQLKQQVAALGLINNENIAEYIQKARLHYPRSHEPWKAPEDELLAIALQQTNDLGVLSACFQRGTNAIEARGKRLLYEQQNSSDSL